MDSPMLKMVKQQNPDKEYPSNFGQKWSDDEEKLLLEELNIDMDMHLIAANHNRTYGSIDSRRKEIAYKMHLKDINIEEIIQKTKLETIQITDIIFRKENKPVKNKPVKNNIEIKTKLNDTDAVILQSSEIMLLKNEIFGLKKDVKEILRLIHEIYNFETEK